MPNNPLSEPLFWPVAIRTAILLGVGLMIIALKERGRLRGLRNSTLFVRLRTWALIAPAFILTLFTGGFVVFLFAAAVGLQASREFVSVTGIETRYASLLYFWLLVSLLVAALGRRYFLFLPLGFFVLLTLIPILSGNVEGSLRQLSATLFGYLFIGLPMGYLVFIKAAEHWGREFLLIVGAAVALSDVAAFTFGSLLKGPKLAPRVSPGKTWSGALGNVAGAAGAVSLFAFAIPDVWTRPGLIAMTATVAVGALWGDLTESTVKRDFRVKDTGQALPGFGGVLDRVDSLLLAMPLGYYALLVGNYYAR